MTYVCSSLYSTLFKKWYELSFVCLKKKHIPLFIRQQTNTICGNVASFSQCTHGRLHFLSHCFTAPWCPKVLDQVNSGLFQVVTAQKICDIIVSSSDYFFYSRIRRLTPRKSGRNDFFTDLYDLEHRLCGLYRAAFHQHDRKNREKTCKQYSF